MTKKVNKHLSRWSGALVCLLLAWALLSGCQERPPPEEAARRFCSTLGRVNAGGVDTAGMAELEGHALVLATLLEDAPKAIRADFEQFHGVFSDWAAAVAGQSSMLDTFAELSDPELAGAQGRIADYIAEHCGIRIGSGEYRVAPRPSAQEICPGWPRVGSPLTFNNFPNLPDIAGANYFANEFMISRLPLSPGNSFSVEPGGWVEFRGRYPRARYFAYHPNDMDLNNLPTLRDIDLDPDPGSANPFREEVQTEGNNYYTARFVFSPPPPDPEPNTRYVGAKKGGAAGNRYVMNLLRLYASDIGNGANSGGVPLPSVSIYNAEGERVRHFKECDLYRRGGDKIRTELKFPELPIADHRAREIPRWSTSSNFEARSDTLSNADVQYLSTVYSRRFGDIFVVRGKYLTAPDTRNDTPVGAPNYDVRLYTLCNYNIWAGHAIQCILDNDLEVGEDGYFTLVIADQANTPANLAEERATRMDWGPFLDGQISIRYVYRDNPLIAAIGEAAGNIEGVATSAYLPIAAPCTRALFERGGWRACLMDR